MTALVLCSLLLLGNADGYEERFVDRALVRLHGARHDAPEGHRIARVRVFSEDIVAADDPYPRILNAPHVTTRESVVRRELLIGEGDVYDDERAKESERNLREMGLFAIARVVPVHALGGDELELWVLTKDLWSIRFNNQFSLVGSVLQFFRTRPRETNLLGFGKTVSLDLFYRRDTLSFGQLYEDRRLFGTPFALSETAGLIFNRGTRALEGSRGEVFVGRPQYFLDQPWAYGLDVDWRVERTRFYRGADVLEVAMPDGTQVPVIYDTRRFGAASSVTHREGERFKRDYTLGVGAYRNAYSPPAGATDAEGAFLVANYLPRREQALYVSAALRVFEPRFIVMHDVYTFSLSEDVQLGPSVYAQARYAAPVVSGLAHFLEAGVRARERELLGGHLVTATASAAARFVPEGDPVLGKTWVDQRLAVQLEEVTPTIGVGRIVARALGVFRRDPLGVPFLQLGGDSGLRGLGAEALRGRNELLFNLEYRTKAIEVKTVHAGLVLFYDAGSVYDVAPNVVHSVGVGLRLLFPQFDVQTVRIDFGWAFNGPQTPLLDRASASFGQVTDARPADLDSPLDEP